MTIDVVIPTYGRPQRLDRVARNAYDNSADIRLIFVVEPSDDQSYAAARATGAAVLLNKQAANYSGAMNTALAELDNEHIFAAADDLRFHPGWDQAALARFDGWVQVVGTNDLLNPYVANGWHATHYLVARRYLTEVGGVVDGGPGSFLNASYTHNYTDTEFIGTAKARAVFRPCLESVVEHLHALAGDGRGEPPDATTAKSYAHAQQDSELYDSRKHLWWGISR